MHFTEVFCRISAELKDEMIQYAYQDLKPFYRQLLVTTANLKRLRPVLLEKMSRTQRHPLMIEALQQPAQANLAWQCIGGWLLGTQSLMLTQFLDSLGIAHDGQGAVDEFPPCPDSVQLEQAVQTLLQHHPAEKVVIYLHAFNNMPETRWPLLDEILQKNENLKL